ncbi:MAG: transposase [Actinomycetota bacterium]
MTKIHEVKKVNVLADHAHLLEVILPRVSVASVIKYMKSQTGKKLKEFSFSKKAIYGRGEIWARGYCVYIVGFNEKTIMDYVEHQYKDDAGQLKLELGK